MLGIINTFEKQIVKRNPWILHWTAINAFRSRQRVFLDETLCENKLKL